MRILLTGAAGYIGRALYNKLTSSDDVVCMDNFSSVNSVASPHCHQNIDITDKELYLKVLGTFDLVIHLAAHVSVIESVHDPVRDARDNILGTVNLLNCVRAKRFIFASSQAVHGKRGDPVSPYGVSKVCCEEYLKLASTEADIQILRICNVYGGDDKRGVFAKFKEAKARGESAIIYGDGTTFRQYIHINDLTDLIVSHIDNPPTGPYSVYPINGRPLTIKQVADLVDVPVIYAPARTGEVQ